MSMTDFGILFGSPCITARPITGANCRVPALFTASKKVAWKVAVPAATLDSNFQMADEFSAVIPRSSCGRFRRFTALLCSLAMWMLGCVFRGKIFKRAVRAEEHLHFVRPPLISRRCATSQETKPSQSTD